MKTDAEILALISERLRDSRDATSRWRTEARECYGFYDGTGQWNEADAAEMRANDRPVVTFNRTQPFIDSVVGSQIVNEQKMVYLPRTEEDLGVTDMYSDTGEWVRQEGDEDDEEADAFMDACVCGMGWTERFIDYDEELDGQIRKVRVDPLEMYWDPAASQTNLADARWRLRVRWMPEDEVQARWPDARISADEAGGEPDEPSQDEIVQLDPVDDYDFDGAAWYDRRRGMIKILQYQWADREGVYRTTNRYSGEEMQVAADKVTEYDADKTNPPLIKQARRRYYQAFATRGQILEAKELHPGKDSAPSPGFTFECITAKRQNDNRTFFGLMRSMMDPQRWANKFFSTMQESLAVSPKGGIIAEVDAFENQAKAEQDWANPTKIVFANPGAVKDGRIMPRPKSDFPAAADRLMQIAIAAIPDTTGINLEFLGLVARNQPNVLENTRIGQGMTILARLFKALRLYRKRDGRMLLHMIRTYIPEGTLVRVTGSKFVPLVHRPDVVRYDVIVDQSPTSPNQRAEIWQTMLMMLPQMATAGLPIPPDILDYAPLPERVIAKLKEFYERQMADPMKQAAAKLELAQKEADVGKTKADTQAGLMKAKAAVIGAQTNVFEAIGEAVRPQQQNKPSKPNGSGPRPPAK